jgi:hypothetical protein
LNLEHDAIRRFRLIASCAWAEGWRNSCSAARMSRLFRVLDIAVVALILTAFT